MRRHIVIAGVLACALAACKGDESKLDTSTTMRGSAPGSGSAAARGSAAGATEVKLCDNHTTVALTELPKDRAGGQAVADQLMAQWRRANPDAEWEANIRRSLTVHAPADNTNVLQGEQREGQTYGRYTELDVKTWARESEKAALEGARVFHSADDLGSTIAVSCDMCHPDAANTHPETYPKDAR